MSDSAARESASSLAPVLRPAHQEDASPTAAPSASASSIDDWTAQVTSVAIVHLDRDGFVTGWNPGAERLKGYSAPQILGEAFTRFYRQEDRDRGLPAQLLAIASERGSVEDTGWRVRADGGLFWAHVVITALHDGAGAVAGYVKIVTDLTAAKAREDADFTFMRAFAHDFLSPITALRGYVDLLAESPFGAGDALQRISTVTDHLATMMVELSGRLHSSEHLAQNTVVDAAATVREAAELVLPGDAYGRLHYRGLAHLGVAADPLALRRAIANIVDNAAKYSEGVIDISVDAADGHAHIVVADHGRGIAEEDLENIFDPLERGRLSNPDDGGTGIGLASTKALIERQHGTITLQSIVGVGTSVTVTLPVDGGPDGLRVGPAPSTASAFTATRTPAAGAPRPLEPRSAA